VKYFTKEDAVELFTELLTAAIASGSTCAQIAERRERNAMHERLELAAANAERQMLAREVPIPPWCVVSIAPSCPHANITTPTVCEPGPNGGQLPIGGGFQITKFGVAARQSLPRSTVDEMLGGKDPMFASLVADGSLRIEALDPREARGFELHLREIAANNRSQAARSSSSSFNGPSKLNTFQGGGNF